jgi:hypothetical protein
MQSHTLMSLAVLQPPLSFSTLLAAGPIPIHFASTIMKIYSMYTVCVCFKYSEGNCRTYLDIAGGLHSLALLHAVGGGAGPDVERQPGVEHEGVAGVEAAAECNTHTQ